MYTQSNTTKPLKRMIFLFATKWVELQDIMLSEISKTQEDEYHIFHHIWELAKTKTKNKKPHMNTEC